MKKSEINKEQIELWKKQYGNVYKLIAEDGKEGYIKDPLTDLRVMKLATLAMAKSMILFVQAIITNCWLGGDEEILNDEQYANGLEDQVHEIAEIPDAQIERIGSKYKINVEGMICEVRQAQRADILTAESKNKANEPFETAKHLLRIIQLKGLDEIKKNTRAYIGLLVAVDKVKNKATIRVEKL